MLVELKEVIHVGKWNLLDLTLILTVSLIGGDADGE